MAVALSSLPVGPGTGANTANGNGGGGTAEIVQFIANTDGTITQVAAFVMSTATVAAANMRYGIYADSGANAPAALLQSVTPSSLTTNAWNYITGFSVAVTNGTKYWVAYLQVNGTAGVYNYSDNAASGGLVYDSSANTLANLPNPFGVLGGGPFANIPNIGVLGDLANPPQKIYPDADTTTTGWVSTPLFSKVNDQSDATVITATLV